MPRNFKTPAATFAHSVPSAAEILSRAADAYARCRTYCDKGETSTVLVTGTKPWERRTTIKRFRTFFERPESLYFEYRDVGVGPESEWSRALVCANPRGITAWSTMHIAHDVPKSIHSALYTLMCVSGGTSGTTPWLLLPSPEHWPLPDARTAQVVGIDSVEGHECCRVRGNDRLGSTFDVWIDSTVHCLRRMSATRAYARPGANDPGHDPTSDGFTIESVTKFAPMFDLPIEQHVFGRKFPDDAL